MRIASRARVTAIAALLCVGTATVHAPAEAQTTADDASTKAARSRFQEGVANYDKEQFEAARAAFLQAYALRKHPVVLLNLGRSSVKSGHAIEGIRYLQQFLKEATGITAEQRASAEAGIAEGRTKAARMDVSGPAGAEVSIDGDRVGVLPLPEAADVEPGSHTVKLRAPDGSLDEKTLSVRAGETAAARFVPKRGAAASAPATPVVPSTAPATGATTPAPTEPPASNETSSEKAPPATDATTASSSTSIFSRPRSMTPVYVGGAIALAGAAGAVVFAISKGTAQNNADAVVTQIRAHGGRGGICNSTNPKDLAVFGASCATLRDDNSKVDTDALAANVSIGVGVAGAALAIGWYLLAPKEETSQQTAARRRLHAAPFAVLPAVAAGSRGFVVVGDF